MAGDVPLHTIPWTETEELRVSVNEYRGVKYFAARVWFKGRDSETYFPGKNGVNVPLDKAQEFVDAIDKGFTRLVAMAKQGHVDLPYRKDEPVTPPRPRGKRGKPSRMPSSVPETREEEQLQRESDERSAFNERLNDARD